MKILVVNCGSSSVKFDLVEMNGVAPALDTARKLAHGLVDRVGPGATIEMSSPAGEVAKRPVQAADSGQAVAQALDLLASSFEGGMGELKREIVAVGHRVVHGGDRFTAPTPIDAALLDSLDQLSELAPLHNPVAIQGIRAAMRVLGDGVTHVAVFDTAFHSTLPPHAYTYAIPYDIAERHKIRRYGFHGIAHEYMLRVYAQHSGTPVEQANIITLQLGNGCSAAAIRGGRSVDTSMGFTPLEGLVMGTRSGDIDPELVGFLAEKESMPVQEVEQLLNRRSGLLGLSGRTQDMRDLLGAMAQSPQAKLAVELFCYRARKYVGAYMAALGGADGLVFGGGIGEHAALVRESICEDMGWCGIELDAERNRAASGDLALISSDQSRVRVLVVPVDESLLVALRIAEMRAA